tara:strand:- start:16398 stop:17087 length:690 start_codon:yes stop_codon:yes gene_type:complete
MINHVRNTVLSVLNKENRGFLTPSEFNYYAKHAQDLIFKRYFDEYNMLNAQARTGRGGDVYADREHILRQNIEKLVKTTAVGQGGGRYAKPVDLYHLLSIRKDDVEIEEVEKKYEKFLKTSNLTAPTDKYPVYVDVNSFITVLPDTVNSNLDFLYIRKLRDPNWTYTVVGEDLLFNGSALDYQDFELSEEDVPALTIEILKLAGVTIREQEVSQLATTIDSTETQKENM